MEQHRATLILEHGALDLLFRQTGEQLSRQRFDRRDVTFVSEGNEGSRLFRFRLFIASASDERDPGSELLGELFTGLLDRRIFFTFAGESGLDRLDELAGGFCTVDDGKKRRLRRVAEQRQRIRFGLGATETPEDNRSGLVE